MTSVLSILCSWNRGSHSPLVFLELQTHDHTVRINPCTWYAVFPSLSHVRIDDWIDDGHFPLLKSIFVQIREKRFVRISWWIGTPEKSAENLHRGDFLPFLSPDIPPFKSSRVSVFLGINCLLCLGEKNHSQTGAAGVSQQGRTVGDYSAQAFCQNLTAAPWNSQEFLQALMHTYTEMLHCKLASKPRSLKAA